MQNFSKNFETYLEKMEPRLIIEAWADKDAPFNEKVRSRVKRELEKTEPALHLLSFLPLTPGEISNIISKLGEQHISIPQILTAHQKLEKYHKDELLDFLGGKKDLILGKFDEKDFSKLQKVIEAIENMGEHGKAKSLGMEILRQAVKKADVLDLTKFNNPELEEVQKLLVKMKKLAEQYNIVESAGLELLVGKVKRAKRMLKKASPA